MFLKYINNFRGIAITYIVAGHSISAFAWDNTPQFKRLTKILLSNGTVFFVFIAGYLFQYLVKNYEPKKYFIAKLKYVLLPYFLVSIPAIVFFVFFQHREGVPIEFYDNPRWLQIISFYITGSHLAPLWFIPMISLFYLISPLLVVLDKNEWIYAFLPLFILISCLVSREGGIYYSSFVHFFSVYVLGMFLSHYREVINVALVKPIFLTALVFAYLPLVGVEFYLMGESTMSFINLLRKLILCALFIGILIRLEGKFNDKYLKILAETSFGIFFVHSYIISAFKKAEENILGHYLAGNLLVFIVFIAVVLLISAVSILIIKRILGPNSRFVVGS